MVMTWVIAALTLVMAMMTMNDDGDDDHRHGNDGGDEAGDCNDKVI